jgi:hypothetical protein
MSWNTQVRYAARCLREKMPHRATLTIALLLTTGTAVLGQLPPQPPPVANPLTQGNDRERAACRPDVIRFCGELVKDDNQTDVFAVLSCLQTNRTRISGPCREVLADHGQ